MSTVEWRESSKAEGKQGGGTGLGSLQAFLPHLHCCFWWPSHSSTRESGEKLPPCLSCPQPPTSDLLGDHGWALTSAGYLPSPSPGKDGGGNHFQAH